MVSHRTKHLDDFQFSAYSILLFNRINHTVILDDPYDDPKGLVIPDRSPEPTKEQLDVRWLSAESLSI